jgi:uncharacterized membrane protein YgdD (TMEM256/DUF423 family)
MERVFAAIGAVLGASGVALGAFGAHALRGKLDSSSLATFETAVRYQFYHALALLAVAWLCSRVATKTIVIAGWLFVVGTLLFSGSLYLIVLTEMRSLGVITPAGGVALVTGWVLMAFPVIRKQPD